MAGGACFVLRAYRDQWEEDGYSFTLDWLLRNINAVGDWASRI